MLQDYLRAYPPPSHADTYLQIQQMAQWLDVYVMCDRRGLLCL